MLRLALTFTLTLTLTLAGCATTGKIPVQSLGDLPRHTYPLTMPVSDLIQSDTDFAAFAAAVRADIEADLAGYEVDDAGTLQAWYRTLEAISALEGDFDRAVELNDRGRAIEDKEAVRAMYGQTLRAMAAAHAATGKLPGDQAFNAAFRETLDAATGALSWNLIQDLVQQAKGNLEILSANLLVGLAQSRHDPVVAKTGEISGDTAPAIISLGYSLRHVLPLKDEMYAVYASLVEANRVEKKNIWPAREVVLDATAGHDSVTVAVWDAGVDAAVFGARMFANDDPPNGKDDDNNGFVDDTHGIAFDLDGNYSTELLHPHGDQAGKVEAAMAHLKGLSDLRAAVDSPEASALKKEISGFSPDAVGGFLESLGFAGLYAHGTHVAGIMEAGNPFVRLLGVRIAFDYHNLPAPITEEVARRHAASYARTAQYLRENDVRVANMSWSWSLKEVEQSLEANGLGAGAEERGVMARRVLAILREGLRSAIESCPDILFVAAAGNADNDAAFAESLPMAIADLPNLIMVGAVDQAGERTSFTSGGKDVTLFANGFEVMSYVPGGDRVKLSGTSMASPNVANLAAKLITLRSQLTPAEVIDLIERGSDELAEQPGLKRINPMKSVELLGAGQS